MSNGSEMLPVAITANQAVTRCDPASLGFETTEGAEPLAGVVGQERALDALAFGARMDGDGFNLYVLGSPGSGRHAVVTDFLRAEARGRPQPLDWCYVNNFADPRKPRGIALPAGSGRALKADLAQLIDDLRASIPAAFESENYRNRVAEIEQEFHDRHQKALDALQAESEAAGLTILPTPHGFGIAPVRDGNVLAEEDFSKLPEEERKRIEEGIQRMTGKLRAHFEGLPVWHKERRQRVRELDRNVMMLAVGALIEELRHKYAPFPAVVAHLDDVERDVLDNAPGFRVTEGEMENVPPMFRQDHREALRRYAVNTFVDHSEMQGAPVVYESHPTHANLGGRVEHASQFGALVTDFTMLRPGALQAASGGYLVLDAEKVLMQPFAWDALKRAIRSHSVKPESIAEMAGLMSAQGVEPDPMPLNVKVVLVGNRLLYYLLCELDPEFQQLFKVAADFEEHIPRSADNMRLFGRMLASVVRDKGLQPFSAAAIGRVIDESARLAGDTQKLSARLQGITDLLREADYRARQRQAARVEQDDVASAIASRIRRLDRARGQLQEEIQRGVIRIETQGSRLAQVNGLSVLRLGEFWFGQPSRITATVRVGDGRVLDIEREVELGGAIHSKGVLILSGFLGATYAREWPLSFSASLVFEQSYGGVEGDSASMAELLALLSAIAGVPLRQDLAVTGSLDQGGGAQPVGGINEKIEGFFDVCHARGLTGNQGVLIPAANVQHLMLRDDVVEAIGAGRFHVYPVHTANEALSLLTGLPAGERDAGGRFPDGSFNRRVEEGLEVLAQRRRAFGANGAGQNGEGESS